MCFRPLDQASRSSGEIVFFYFLFTPTSYVYLQSRAHDLSEAGTLLNAHLFECTGDGESEASLTSYGIAKKTSR